MLTHQTNMPKSSNKKYQRILFGKTNTITAVTWDRGSRYWWSGLPHYVFEVIHVLDDTIRIEIIYILVTANPTPFPEILDKKNEDLELTCMWCSLLVVRVPKYFCHVQNNFGLNIGLCYVQNGELENRATPYFVIPVVRLLYKIGSHYEQLCH